VLSRKTIAVHYADEVPVTGHVDPKSDQLVATGIRILALE
jgi:hypothetical protein